MRRLRLNSVSIGVTERQLDFIEQSPQPSHTSSLMMTRRSTLGLGSRLRRRRGYWIGVKPPPAVPRSRAIRIHPGTVSMAGG